VAELPPDERRQIARDMIRVGLVVAAVVAVRYVVRRRSAEYDHEYGLLPK